MRSSRPILWIRLTGGSCSAAAAPVEHSVVDEGPSISEIRYTAWHSDRPPGGASDAVFACTCMHSRQLVAFRKKFVRLKAALDGVRTRRIASLRTVENMDPKAVRKAIHACVHGRNSCLQDIRFSLCDSSMHTGRESSMPRWTRS